MKNLKKLKYFNTLLITVILLLLITVKEKSLHTPVYIFANIYQIEKDVVTLLMAFTITNI